MLGPGTKGDAACARSCPATPMDFVGLLSHVLLGSGSADTQPVLRDMALIISCGIQEAPGVVMVDTRCSESLHVDEVAMSPSMPCNFVIDLVSIRYLRTQDKLGAGQVLVVGLGARTVSKFACSSSKCCMTSNRGMRSCGCL
jgi:hypothetical protein